MLEVQALTIRAGADTLVKDLSLRLEEGSLTCLIGPSGCGKSSLVKWLAGVLAPDLHAEGAATIDGTPVTFPHRDIAYQPQQDTLFPWLTTAENACLGLEIGGMDRRAARDRVKALFPAFGLEGHEESFPDQLSGGMRQRAAFLRTIVQDARVLLLDEPFSALDAVTRLHMQDWLVERLAERPRAALMVTHDLFEATQMADRVLVMASGPGRLVADIPIPMPSAERSETALAEIRSKLKLMLLKETS
ncbi:ABC transporter ATP-binding protein [Rhodalgimonas zhirmunskyi]|uniref:ABC transporter ATP-binding protein n=1 Tax=Rhodalgimonas zhirmunskyi TaxID=2964767 RepID=A0AAJ1U8A2_9RHOB|nr:ABC transporter ATP-binding protein [Rhodoalgimonas zhirmunskyi]MDQ2093600.1 ABC transporter ATP-binding protein [Rhodoalgimonas zhirmunskyi]